MDSSFIVNICITSESMSTDTTDGTSTVITHEASHDSIPGSSIGDTGNRHHDSFPNKIFIDLEVNVACSQLKSKSNPTGDRKLGQEVHAINGNITDRAWYADIVNYVAAGVERQRIYKEEISERSPTILLG